MGHVRVHNAEKRLSFCHLTKQLLINGLEDGVNERHGRHEDASPDYRPKLHVFTEKAGGEKRGGGRASQDESFLLPCAATGVSLLAVWCLSGATPRSLP
jgi:hypothetical protein